MTNPHPYQRDPQSGAGNCTCGRAEHSRAHPHKYRQAALCVCVRPPEDPIHTDTSQADSCRIYEDDEGQPVRVHGGKPLDEEGREALKQVIAAAKRRFDLEHSGDHQETPMADTDVRDVIVSGAQERWCKPVVTQAITWQEIADAVVADLEAAGLVVVPAEDVRALLPRPSGSPVEVTGVSWRLAVEARLRAALPVTEETRDA